MVIDLNAPATVKRCGKKEDPRLIQVDRTREMLLIPMRKGKGVVCTSFRWDSLLVMSTTAIMTILGNTWQHRRTDHRMLYKCQFFCKGKLLKKLRADLPAKDLAKGMDMVVLVDTEAIDHMHKRKAVQAITGLRIFTEKILDQQK